ncbi:tRNA1(Val) (adenine(37)-N6)-methyltransferase [Mordavella massiliensis]|nr:tRNA1(Val) (adenine(37)-N6)-methyltransferase [Mordavella massiliensis]
MNNNEPNGKKGTDLIRPGEHSDDLQIKGRRIIQSPGRFCFGMDAVLLSAFAHVRTGERALDLGTGTGILPILLEAKYDGSSYTGLEIQEESAGMARRSVALNGLEEKIHIVTGDIKEAASIFGAASFEVITVNPPYMIGGHGLRNDNQALYVARHEALCTIDDVLRESGKLLKDRGRFYMVHRPFRLPELLTKMAGYGLEPKRMRLVHPYVDKEPNMVLLEGLKGGKPRMQIEPPLIVYEKDGNYTGELRALYGE